MFQIAVKIILQMAIIAFLCPLRALIRRTVQQILCVTWILQAHWQLEQEAVLRKYRHEKFALISPFYRFDHFSDSNLPTNKDSLPKEKPSYHRLFRIIRLWREIVNFGRDKFTGYCFAPFIDAFTDSRHHINMRGWPLYRPATHLHRFCSLPVLQK